MVAGIISPKNCVTNGVLSCNLENCICLVLECFSVTHFCYQNISGFDRSELFCPVDSSGFPILRLWTAVPETGKYNFTGFFVCDIIGSNFYLGEITVYDGYKAAVEKKSCQCGIYWRINVTAKDFTKISVASAVVIFYSRDSVLLFFFLICAIISAIIFYSSIQEECFVYAG